jgi:hypothetical protein
MFTSCSSDEPIDTKVHLRGAHNLQKWNLHNGEVEELHPKEQIDREGTKLTIYPLQLDPVKSTFWIGK